MSIGILDIEPLVRDAWSSMGGLELASTPTVEIPDPGITSQIEIQGVGELVLRIDCSLSLARQMAADIADLPVDEVELDLVMDAIGEVVNILGGNIKGRWPSAVKQSLPLTWETDKNELESYTWAISKAFDSTAGQLVVRMTKPD